MKRTLVVVSRIMTVVMVALVLLELPAEAAIGFPKWDVPVVEVSEDCEEQEGTEAKLTADADTTAIAAEYRQQAAQAEAVKQAEAEKAPTAISRRKAKASKKSDKKSEIYSWDVSTTPLKDYFQVVQQ